jgi:prepilin-type N-terminal cleavage/methylation domain-containing protein
MKQKAFTLIELLVVIAVIGVISSIVLVNLSGSREKARVSRSLQFSKNIHHALGANAIAIWSFDRFGDPITDLSGYNNHCTPVNNPIEVGGIIGKGVEFNGTDNRLSCGNNDLRMSTSSGITVEAWAKPYTINNPGKHKIVAKNQFFYLSIRNGVAYHDSWITDWGGPDLEGITKIKTGRWYHFAFTWDGVSTVKLYLDGNEEDEDTTDKMNFRSVGSLNIGTFDTNGGWFHGIIDEVRIYNEPLTLGQIQKHYAEGLKRHKLVEE